jgi:hypothetical protein
MDNSLFGRLLDAEVASGTEVLDEPVSIVIRGKMPHSRP